MWSEPRRAHPASVVLYTIRYTGVLWTTVFGLGLAISSARESTQAALGIALLTLGLLVAAISSIGMAWWQWRRFTFHIEGGALRVEQGILIRKSTRLTAERIQSVDTKANIIFRAFGLVTLDIYTAGRGKVPEVSIPALAVSEAAELVSALRARTPSADSIASGPAEETSESPAPGPTWRLSARDLGIVAVTSTAVLFVAASLVPVLGGLVLMISDDSIGEWLLGIGGPGTVFTIIASFFLFLMVAWVIGSVGTALQYWDFIVARQGNEIRVEQGLLQRNTRNVPLDRVQAVRLVEGPLRQMIGRVTVGVDAAGIASGSELGPTVLHPFLTVPEARRFCAVMLTGHSIPALKPPPTRARRRYVVRATILPALISVPLALLAPYGWLALGLPVVAMAWALLAYAEAGWGVSGDVLSFRWRGFSRTTALVRRRRIQSIAVSQNPLQRIASLASVSIQVAASPSAAAFTIRHLDEADAHSLIQWVSQGVEFAQIDV